MKGGSCITNKGAGETHNTRKCDCKGDWEGATCSDEKCNQAFTATCKNGLFFIIKGVHV